MPRTVPNPLIVIPLLPFVLLAACADEPPVESLPPSGIVISPDGPSEESLLGGEGSGAVLKALPANATVSDAIYGTCTTASIRALSEQLLEEINCLRPGTLARIDGVPNVQLGSATIPWMQAPAANALRKAAANRTMAINSATRTLPQQYVLYQWYRQGACGISLAAWPGTSNHESGLALDVDNYGSARSALGSWGFRWLGGSDPVHFDFVGGGAADLSGLSILAFQRLWNRNHPEDRIAEDGDFGPATAQRLGRAPARGFASGSSCRGGANTSPQDDGGIDRSQLAAIEVYWARQADGSYDLRALAPQRVVRVEYTVDGYEVGDVRRSAGQNFPTRYTFQLEQTARHLEVFGFDQDDELVALGDGLIDITGGTAVYIKQMGQGLYEIGLERAPAGVAAIEVQVDGQWTLTDQVSQRQRSTRLAVRSTFNQPGERDFVIQTFNADGTARGSLRRSFEVTAR